MALIKCPVCQKDVSSMVLRCPFCNADLTQVNISADQDDTYYDPNSDPEPDRSPDHSESYRQKSGTQGTRGRAALRTEKTGSQQTSEASVSRPPRKKKKSAPPAGRRLLGYRAGNPFYMLFSIFYHMAACVGILYAFSLSPFYASKGTLLFHICRVFLAAVMLFLPVLFLSESKFRRKLFRKPSAVIKGLLILYIPLTALFLVSWNFCM